MDLLVDGNLCFRDEDWNASSRSMVARNSQSGSGANAPAPAWAGCIPGGAEQ